MDTRRAAFLSVYLSTRFMLWKGIELVDHAAKRIRNWRKK